MKQVTAFLTFDDKLFEDEAEAREHEKSLLNDAKKSLCKSEKFV